MSGNKKVSFLNLIYYTLINIFHCKLRVLEVKLKKYTSRFSGHQTFPLRYGWLYKYYQTSLLTNFKELSADDLMVEWGVGKNMVDALKYWAARIGADANEASSFEYAEIHTNDSHLESFSSVWLIHWLLCRDTSELTAYRLFFNYYNGQTVEKTSLLLFIKELFESKQFIADTKSKSVLKLPSENTINKDISTLFLTYSSKHSSKISEDNFSSPLSELGLLKQFEKQTYLCELEERTSLPDSVFIYTLIDYFESKHAESIQESTISFDSFLMGEGSPARVFRMSQSEIELRLEKVSVLTNGKIGWTDTQGLRQIQIKDHTIFSEKKSFLNKIY